jgi:hypothetical protein
MPRRCWLALAPLIEAKAVHSWYSALFCWPGDDAEAIPYVIRTLVFGRFRIPRANTGFYELSGTSAAT